MQIFTNNSESELCSKVKSQNLDDLYVRFLVISAIELEKLEKASTRNSAPISDDYLKRFESLARVTRDISTELRNYKKDKVQLDDEQIMQILKGIISQRPELIEQLGVSHGKEY